MTEEQYVIEMRKITKQFGDFKANDEINLKIRKGEIHALLGENGAGKSTLMNVLSGLLQPTSGEIYMDGQAVKITSPTRANQLGIGMVHQHFMLVDAFTVTENIILGSDAHIHFDIMNFDHIEGILEEIDFPKELIVNYDVDEFLKYIDKKV